VAVIFCKRCEESSRLAKKDQFVQESNVISIRFIVTCQLQSVVIVLEFPIKFFDTVISVLNSDLR
jgi:hypothetical protein